MNQRERRARSLRHPNGALVTFIGFTYVQVMAQLLKWLYTDTMLADREEEATWTKLFEPPPFLREDDYIYLANDAPIGKVTKVWADEPLTGGKGGMWGL